MFVCLRAIACVRQLDASRQHWWYAKFQLAGRVKGQADRAGDAFGAGDLRERASSGVDTEDDDGIGVLVFGEEEAAGWIDGEVTWLLAAGREITSRIELARGGNSGKDCHRILATVGREEPFAARVNGDFRRFIATLEIDGKHGHDPKISEYAVVRGVG